MNIAFIGLGLMGSRMVKHLLSSHNVTVYNRTRGKEDEFVSLGARKPASLIDSVKGKDVVISMLAHPQAVEETALGSGGFLQYMEKDSVWVDCSTVNPSFSKKLADRAGEHGVYFIDAPVSGTTIPAEKGELIFLIGGEAFSVNKVLPVLKLMGKKHLHLGSTGMGSAMKLVINNMLAVSMAAFAESLIMGEKLGFSKEDIFSVLLGGPVTAPFLQAKREKLSTSNYDVQFPIEWMAKDVMLAIKTAGENNINLPLLEKAAELYSAAANEEFVGKDFSIIYEYLSK